MRFEQGTEGLAQGDACAHTRVHTYVGSSVL